ncbi:MAG: pyruvate kinase [Gemmataceae bacterium]|nr:pyruvate kinase [Gemmataceae bacterium]MDW8263743.1 pyruvate kinase [Gemmataceae bacterium]
MAGAGPPAGTGEDLMRRRTRIVATLGPATDRPGVLEAILNAGLDVVRINFSHGTPADHLARIRRLREAAAGLARPVAILADLPGPKLRAVLSAPIVLVSGREVTFGPGHASGADIGVTEPEVLADVRPGQRILLDDGRLQLCAVRIGDGKVVAHVEVGGTLLPGKGINLPDTTLSIPSLTPRDRDALAIAAQAGVDWLALSFVRDAAAADELRSAARAHYLDAPILAKIERPEAVARADRIIDAFDGIMVARGDLGVEIPLEQVPHVQKALITQARRAAKPVITATDMLDSMRLNPRPTRAEASDVANAIYDGSDAVMLSGETAVGQYPVEAVACMDRIAREAEKHRADFPELSVPVARMDDHVSQETCDLARKLQAQAIIAPTRTGRLPRLIARHRPPVTIVAATPDPGTLRRLALVWGLSPVLLPDGLAPGTDRLDAAVRAAFHSGAVSTGDLAVVVAHHPAEGGECPTIRVVRIGPNGQPLAPA